MNSSQYGPLKDGPDVTIIGKAGEVPESAPLSRRKQEHVSLVKSELNECLLIAIICLEQIYTVLLNIANVLNESV